MTETEFISRLDAIKRKSLSRLFWYALFNLYGIVAVWWYFLYRTAGNAHARLISASVIVGVFFVLIGIVIWDFRTHIFRDIPLCPHCRKPLTERERKAILTSRACPRCQHRLFDHGSSVAFIPNAK